MSAPWLISARADLTFLLGPPLAAGALALALPPGLPVSPALWLVLVLAIDVAHVYASLWRSYLDPDERERRPALLVMAPLGCLVGAALVHTLAPGWFWTAMAYLAAFHFVRQAMGMSMLYRARAGLPMGDAAARVERWLATGLALFPLLWWHARLPRSFDWFLPGDFLPGLPPALLWPAGLALGALAVAHAGLRLREGRASPGRDLQLLATGLVWFGGIVLTDDDLAFTVSNVVAHGLPYLALVAWTTRRKWEVEGQGPGRAAWFRGAGLAVFLAPLLALAFVEEALWDALVWAENAWLFGDWGLEAALTHPLVPLLATPQLTHYVLDGFLWRTREDPRLARWLIAADAPPR